MEIFDQIKKYKKEIDEKLLEIYPKGPNSLVEPINYVLNGGGKRLRPILAIFSAISCGGNKHDIMPVALAIEILHNFTLVHDDIMDGDLVRHDQKTVHDKWDEGVAILTGDAMLSLALKLILQSNDHKEKQITLFIEGLLAVCEGQALDKEFETKSHVSLNNYLEMIDLKTGYMIGLSAHMGAMSTNADLEICTKLRNYGRLIGRAFQIQDDYLEIFSNHKDMGKSLESDILLGKKTMLMIMALDENKILIDDAINGAKKDFERGMLEIRRFINDSGISQYVLNEINQNIELANKEIEDLDINKENLMYFSSLIKMRES